MPLHTAKWQRKRSISFLVKTFVKNINDGEDMRFNPRTIRNPNKFDPFSQRTVWLIVIFSRLLRKFLGISRLQFSVNYNLKRQVLRFFELIANSSWNSDSGRVYGSRSTVHVFRFYVFDLKINLRKETKQKINGPRPKIDVTLTLTCRLFILYCSHLDSFISQLNWVKSSTG